jgi:hypothetical protein
MTEKDNKDVKVAVELLDDDDEELEMLERDSGRAKASAKDNAGVADLNDVRKVLSNYRNSAQRMTEAESKTSRPPVLRAPSFSTVTDQADSVPAKTIETFNGNPNKENTPTPSRRIWTQRLVKQSSDIAQNSSDAPPSPSMRTSPPRSPRRFRGKENMVAISKIPPFDKPVKESDVLVPVSPSTETPRCSSPMKAFGQRAMGSILRSRKKNADDNSDPTLEVSEDLTANISKSNHAPPMSPTKRAIAGILRVCSLHDRSSPVKGASAHDRNKNTGTSTSISVSKNNRLSSHDQVNQNKDNENNSEKIKANELDRGEAALPSGSERGTRSSVRVVENDSEHSYSRAVKSLVSPRQKAKRRIRTPATQEADKGEKNRTARPGRRSDNGSTSTSTRIRSSSTGGLSGSSQKQSRRLSNGNSVKSTRDESSLCTEVKPCGRTRSQSRSRRLSSHSCHRDSTTGSRSQSKENLTIQKHREALTRRSSSRQKASTDCTEMPRTPRSCKSREVDARKSTSRSSSRRNVSDLQISLTDDHLAPKSSKADIPAEDGKSVTRSSSRRGISELRTHATDNPRTPELSRSRGKVDDNESCVKRSTSRRNISDIQLPAIDRPTTPLSSRSRDRSSHSKILRRSRSRSSCPVSSSTESEKQSMRRVNSTRIVRSSNIEVSPTEEEKSHQDHQPTANSTAHKGSSRVTKRVGTTNVITKSPRRSRATDDESLPTNVSESRRSTRQLSNTTDSDQGVHKENEDAISHVLNKQSEGTITGERPERRQNSRNGSKIPT